MKNSIQKTKAMFFSVFASLFLLTSCGDKVDGHLDKMEDIISEYEEKAEDKKFSYEDELKLSEKIEKLEDEFKLKVGRTQDSWTADQKAAAVRLHARYEKLEAIAREQIQELRRLDRKWR